VAKVITWTRMIYLWLPGRRLRWRGEEGGGGAVLSYRRESELETIVIGLRLEESWSALTGAGTRKCGKCLTAAALSSHCGRFTEATPPGPR